MIVDGVKQQVGQLLNAAYPARHRRYLESEVECALSRDIDLEILRRLLVHMRRHSATVFVDVGAALGLHLMAVEDVVRVPTVAYEPNPRSVKVLRRAFPEVDVRQVALGDRAGWTSLSVPRLPSGRRIPTLGSINGVDDIGGGVDNHRVEVARLDDCSLPPGRLVMKIDAEGSELDVLNGAHELLPRVDVAIVECEERHRPGAPGEVIELMTNAGLTGHLIHRRQLVPVADYDPDIHQPTSVREAMSAQGLFADELTDGYGNNFIFTRADELTAVAIAAPRAGGDANPDGS